jgi:hypothetical protein
LFFVLWEEKRKRWHHRCRDKQGSVVAIDSADHIYILGNIVLLETFSLPKPLTIMMSLSSRSFAAVLVLLLAPPTVAFGPPWTLPRPKSAVVVSKDTTKPTFVKSALFLSSSAEGINGVENKAPPPTTEGIFSFAKLRKISNFASVLCVLDCTILPIITVALPLLGFLNLGAAELEFFHYLGHQLALFFVLPVGGLTTVVNYLSHKKAWISSLAMVGLFMVGMANSHIHDLPLLGHVHLLHAIQHGPMHRVVNIMGCAFLLGSNYLSQQEGCAHDHSTSSSESSPSHSHSHDHHSH